MPSTIDQKLTEIYQQKTDIEHILDAPDTYIGTVDSDTTKNWIQKYNDVIRIHRYLY